MTEQTENHNLGGTRQSLPVADEMSYPLTKDEYLTIKENLSFDKLSNLESFLLSTLGGAAISAILFFYSVSFIEDNAEKSVGGTIEWNHVLILSIYVGISVGCLIGFIISKLAVKKSKKTFERLDAKILDHLK